MLFIIIFLVLLFIVDIAAVRWGYDSRDILASEEWERRHRRDFPSVEIGYTAKPRTRSIRQERSLRHIQREYSPC